MFETLAHGRADDRLVREIRRITRLVESRGSCRHPDGTTRMLRSALSPFATDIERHRDGGCVAA